MSLDSSWDLYKTFYAVAKSSSFSKAADKLCITQPSISYAAKQLESNLDTKLFYRTPSGVKLTPDGTELLNYVEKSYNLLSNAERNLKESKDFSHGKITVGVPSHIGEFFLFPFVERFHKEHPNIEISIVSRNTEEMIKFLENNSIDFIINMISQISKLTPGRVNFNGTIETIRDKKSMQFVIVKDFSEKIQLFIDKVQFPEIGEIFLRLVQGATVNVEGELIENENVKLGGREVRVDKVEVTSFAKPNPIDENSTIDYKLDYRWLDLRTDKNQLMFKIQTLFVNACREFLIEKDFVEIHSPKLIATASESGSEVFEVKYFNTKAYLAQSPQFYKQMAMAGGLGRIFECGPVFRAEKSHSRKHATEFTGFDLEFSNIDSYEDVMVMEEEMLNFALKKVREKYGKQIKEVFKVDIIVPTLPFPRMKLKDVYVELKEKYNYTCPEEEQDDLTTEAEKLLKDLAKDKYNHEFIFVTDFGPRKRAFYHLRKDGIPQGYDLIWKGVEITTGAQREHRYEILKKQAEEKGLAKDVEFYLQFFKYGCPPHGGFGIGVDRITMNLLELASIKESMYAFRGPERLTP